MELLGLDWHAWMVIVLVLGMFATMLNFIILAANIFITLLLFPL